MPKRRVPRRQAVVVPVSFVRAVVALVQALTRLLVAAAALALFL